MLMKNRKLYQMLAVTAGVLLLSGCGASSAQETGITSSDPQEPTTISEETKASESTESTENTKSTESKASESESSAETAAETESQLQQSEIQPQQTDQQISRINYYDADGKLIYYDSYAYYDNGLLCSTTLHSVDYYDNGNGEQDSYTGNEYTFLYLYDADGNIKTTMPGSLTIADNYNDETGEFVLDYDYDADGNSTPLIIYPKEESIEQEKFHVDPSKTERIYGAAPILPTRAENGWTSSYLNEIFSQDAPTDMTEVRFLDINDDGQRSSGWIMDMVMQAEKYLQRMAARRTRFTCHMERPIQSLAAICCIQPVDIWVDIMTRFIRLKTESSLQLPKAVMGKQKISKRMKTVN